MKKMLEGSKYKWVVAAVCFLIIFTALGFCSSSKSLFLKPVTDTLNIKRSLFSITDSIRYVITAVFSVYFGSLVSKFGAKKIVCAGLLSLSIAMIIYSFASSVYVFYIGGVFLGLGMSFTTTNLVGYVIGKWFKKNRGTVMGIILASNGIGAATAAQILTPVIHASTEGFRNGYRVCALAVFIVFILTAILFKEKPKGTEDGAKFPSKKSQPKRARVWVGMSYQEAIRKPYFWILVACVFLGAATTNTTSAISAAHFGDVGLDTAFIATALSLHSLALTVSKVLAGFSFDRFGLRFTSLFLYLIAAISMFMLSAVNATSYTLAGAFQIIISFAMPVNTVMVPLYAADMFGEKAYVKIMGILLAACYTGYAVATPITNLVYDMTGTYAKVSFVYGVISLVICVVFQIMLIYSGKVRTKIIEAENAAKEA